MKFPYARYLHAAALLIGALGLGAALALPSLALAQSKPGAANPTNPSGAQAIGDFGDWQALTYREGNADVCYAASLPKKSEAHQPKLGAANILVTHWPARKNFGVVSVAIGTDYKKDSHVELQIGSDRFSLFTQGNRAWANDGDDARIVAAFKAGHGVVVRATPAKGPKSTDVYSLDGFTKALDAASKACHVKG
jgi:invasion protein IalB